MNIPEIQFLESAVVCPIQNFNVRQKTFYAGVISREGVPCELAEQKKTNFCNIPPQIPAEPVKHLSGRWLFCGMLQNRHFGHFLTESLTRLWAVKQCTNIDGILFYLRSPEAKIAGFVDKITTKLVGNIKVHYIIEPTRVEELIVPSHLGHEKHGHILNHRYNAQILRSLTCDDHTRPNADKIYVSRSNLRGHEGAFLNEKHLENLLEKEGYLIVHPQEMTIDEQIYYYANAKKLIFADGSAFHLFVLVANQEQDVFVVWRRKKHALFDEQLRSFTGKNTKGQPCLQGYYALKSDNYSSATQKSILNFEELRAQLHSSGFIASSKWAQPSNEQVHQEVQELQQRFQKEYEFFES